MPTHLLKWSDQLWVLDYIIIYTHSYTATSFFHQLRLTISTNYVKKRKKVLPLHYSSSHVRVKKNQLKANDSSTFSNLAGGGEVEPFSTSISFDSSVIQSCVFCLNCLDKENAKELIKVGISYNLIKNRTYHILIWVGLHNSE